jgi:hypothetical protein
VRAEREIVAFPIERVELPRFDTFMEEEHERLYRALYFVTREVGRTRRICPKRLS